MSDSESGDSSASSRFDKSLPGQGVRRPLSSSDEDNSAGRDLKKLVSQKVKEVLEQRRGLKRKLTPNLDLIPIFDPEKNVLSPNNWLNKIEQMGKVHGWDDQMMSYGMQSRLGGIARIWFENLTDYEMTWIKWKEALLKAFPASENYAESLKKNA
ncbi:hypothetical protein NQ314_009983 [Rhamnusium bicolor]|uniref:Retrotransposon gag domain-containing protein n=1 Tax=Rhamnusium bicolor TaxID=1586634 RepID=A0AAV8XU68_9CUCU|nr:hypothetical protein NQ314_009983 [Rhamnusium bicolor]